MNDTFLALIILAIFIAAAIVVYFLIKKHEKTRNLRNKKAKFDDKPRLKLNLPFLSPSEVKFLAVFQNSLPSEYVAFPKVVMNQIVKPNGSLVVYNEVSNNMLDVVVFLKTKMQPVLVVDLIDPTKGDRVEEKLSEWTIKSLKSVKIPVMNVVLDHDFERVELLNSFLEHLDPVELAKLSK